MPVCHNEWGAGPAGAWLSVGRSIYCNEGHKQVPDRFQFGLPRKTGTDASHLAMKALTSPASPGQRSMRRVSCCIQAVIKTSAWRQINRLKCTLFNHCRNSLNSLFQVSKPIMEKRRRERINHSLESLRLLMLEQTHDEVRLRYCFIMAGYS